MSLVKLKNNRDIDIWVNPDNVNMLFQTPGAIPPETIISMIGAMEKFNETGPEVARKLGWDQPILSE